jgi:hypothetical protein
MPILAPPPTSTNAIQDRWLWLLWKYVTAGSVTNSVITNTAATYTVLGTDYRIIQTTAASVYTLPDATVHLGDTIAIVTQFAGTVTSASANVVPLAGGAAGTAILAATAGKWATLQSNGVSWVIVESN